MEATTSIEMRPMKISWDKVKKSFYALMPSQSGGKPHKVHFFEPPKGMPCDFSCDCRGFYFRLHCSHVDALKAYYDAIYDNVKKFAIVVPVVETPAPVAEPTPATDKEQLAEEIDALLADLEAECDAIVAEVETSELTTCPQVAPDVTSYYNEHFKSTCYYVDGRGVKVDPKTGKFACLCSSGPCFKDKWVNLADGCEHVRIVMSDPERVARREAEMGAVCAPVSSSEDMTVEQHFAELDVAAYQRRLEAMSLGKLKSMIKDALGYTYGYPTKSACIWTLVKRYESQLEKSA